MAMSKESAWDYALGMLKVDGLEPSADMFAMIEKEKKGEMTTDEIRSALIKKYQQYRMEHTE